jgi:hypothetical protein
MEPEDSSPSTTSATSLMISLPTKVLYDPTMWEGLGEPHTHRFLGTTVSKQLMEFQSFCLRNTKLSRTQSDKANNLLVKNTEHK